MPATFMDPLVSPAAQTASAAPKKARSPWSCACLGCLGVPLVLLLVVLGAGAYVAAAAGLADVPVFTSLVYRRPEPVHVVTVPPASTFSLLPPETLQALASAQNAGDPAALSGALNDQALQNLFAKLTQFGSQLPKPGGSFSYTIPESVLTATLRQVQLPNIPPPPGAPSAPPHAPQFPFDMAQAQIALSKEKGMEVYLPLQNNPVHSAVRLYVRPFVDQQSLSADLTEAWVGDLQIPSWITQSGQNALRAALQAADSAVKNVAVFTRVDVEDGSLRLEGTFVLK